MYYSSSENEGTDQLRDYRSTYLRLYFSYLKNTGFLMLRLFYYIIHRLPKCVPTNWAFLLK